MDVQSIKQRFGIIGNSPMLDRAIGIASQVAPTDLSVLIYGESGTGKEVFPKIIHQLSPRKHGSYIAVNCGAIPEGTIDSELFGHEKGSFTGANEARKGYFEVANNGTIFLDEVAELPLLTQVRLLRVLESGEFIKVGSSNVLKTNVRVVAATNVNIPEAIQNGKFREDLYYRLNTVPIFVPPIRDRKEDILLLFRKFANDFAEKYRMPSIVLEPDAQELLVNYRWSGNVRQLKNFTEQISVIEKERSISKTTIIKYLPQNNTSELPVLLKNAFNLNEVSDRDILYKVLFDMKRDINELKKLVVGIMQENRDQGISISPEKAHILSKLYKDINPIIDETGSISPINTEINTGVDEEDDQIIESEILHEENFSLEKIEKNMIIKALDKYNGKRKYAASDLGISERTLYRKIKEYGIE